MKAQLFSEWVEKRGEKRMEVELDRVKNVCQRGLDVSGDADGNSP